MIPAPSSHQPVRLRRSCVNPIQRPNSVEMLRKDIINPQ
jgi:hypothetical protein